MDFDAVETRLKRVRGAALETLDDPGNSPQRQRAGLGDIGEGSADKSLALGADRRRRDRRAVIGLQRGVRNAPDMPDLNVDAAAARVHAIRYLAPARDLFLRVDAGRVLITLTLLRDLAGLGPPQAGVCRFTRKFVF